MQRILVNEPVPDLLVCVCIDGVLAVGEKIIFSHREPVSAVTNTYSQVFNTLAFLRTDLTTKELSWLAMRPHDQDVLWELAEPSLLPRCWSFPEILAVVSAEAFAALEARSANQRGLDSAIRSLRWSLQYIRNTWRIPTIPLLYELTSCQFVHNCYNRTIFRDVNGKWEMRESELLENSSALTVKGSAEQMLWLSQYPDFLSVLQLIPDYFGSTEIHLEQFLSLKAALDIWAFRGSIAAWVDSVDVVIQELDQMLINGVTIPEY